MMKKAKTKIKTRMKRKRKTKRKRLTFMIAGYAAGSLKQQLVAKTW